MNELDRVSAVCMYAANLGGRKDHVLWLLGGKKNVATACESVRSSSSISVVSYKTVRR